MSKLRICILIIFGLAYTGIYILCETIARVLINASIPKLFIVIVSIIAWIIIIFYHFPQLKDEFSYRRVAAQRPERNFISVNDDNPTNALWQYNHENRQNKKGLFLL